MANTSLNNTRILAQGIMQSNDTRLTGINNNDLIIGPTGAGKTRGYVIPNLIHPTGESLIVADTKGNLHKAYGDHLRSLGYEVQVLDFMDCVDSPCGFDPLRAISNAYLDGRPIQQDVLRISAAFCPLGEFEREPYWTEAAQMMLASYMALVLERFHPDDHSMATVCHLVARASKEQVQELFDDLAFSRSDSFAVMEHRLSTLNATADKMYASVVGVLVNALHPYCFEGATHLFRSAVPVDPASLGRKKTALFLTISDNDRSMDRLVNAFYTQALQDLTREADRRSDSALAVPVRFILDDFAANTVIPDFDKIITTIRSRGIAVSLIVQDLAQLQALYGDGAGSIIANNCDTWLYLGGQDVETAEMLARKLNKPADAVLGLGLDEAFLMRRGGKPQRVRKHDLTLDVVHEAILADQPTSPEHCPEPCPEDAPWLRELDEIESRGAYGKAA